MSNFDYTGYLRNNILLKEVDEPGFESPEKTVPSDGLSIGDIVILTRGVNTVISNFPKGEEMEIISGHKNLPGYHLRSTRDGGQVWGLEPGNDFKLKDENYNKPIDEVPELNEEHTLNKEEIFKEWRKGEKEAGNLEAYVKDSESLEGDSKSTFESYFKAVSKYPNVDREEIAVAISDILWVGEGYEAMGFEDLSKEQYISLGGKN